MIASHCPRARTSSWWIKLAWWTSSSLRACTVGREAPAGRAVPPPPAIVIGLRPLSSVEDEAPALRHILCRHASRRRRGGLLLCRRRIHRDLKSGRQGGAAQGGAARLRSVQMVRTVRHVPICEPVNLMCAFYLIHRWRWQGLLLAKSWTLGRARHPLPQLVVPRVLSHPRPRNPLLRPLQPHLRRLAALAASASSTSCRHFPREGY